MQRRPASSTRTGTRFPYTTLFRSPLGLQSDDLSEVTVTFDGVESFGNVLYLYDTETDNYVELYSGMSITTPGTTAGRYYILGSEPIKDTEQSLSIYTQEKAVYLSASSGLMIEQVIAFDAGGMLAFSEGNIYQEQFKFDLVNSGIYLVRIVTSEGMILKKIVVK